RRPHPRERVGAARRDARDGGRLRAVGAGGRADLLCLRQGRTHRTRTLMKNDRRALLKAGAALGATLAFPAIVRAQADTIKLGHLTPRTGFLGQLGDYGFKAASMAVDEVNAAGGVLGRKIELVS